MLAVGTKGRSVRMIFTGCIGGYMYFDRRIKKISEHILVFIFKEPNSKKTETQRPKLWVMTAQP
jgi:hypothetical protein